MPVLVNKSRRAVVVASRGVAIAPGKSHSFHSLNGELLAFVNKGILAPMEALSAAPAPKPAPEPAPEPVVVPETAPEPAPEPEAGAEPRRRGRPAKSEA